jgi:hypothetical protein
LRLFIAKSAISPKAPIAAAGMTQDGTPPARMPGGMAEDGASAEAPAVETAGSAALGAALPTNDAKKPGVFGAVGVVMPGADDVPAAFTMLL